MKIAVPCSEKDINGPIYQAFGRAPYFLIVDSESMGYEIIENAAMNAGGGAGIQAAQIVADSGAEVLIAPRCGQNAANVLMPAGVKLMKAVSGTIAEVVDLYKQGKLETLEDIHAGHHGQRLS